MITLVRSLHSSTFRRRFWREPELCAAFEMARRITAHYAKSFYFAASILPAERRWATYAVYGFCRYADNLIDAPRGRTPEELYAEVEALRQELLICYRTGESEHPVMRAFAPVAVMYGIDIRYALDLLKGVTMDMEYSRYQTFDELYVFCYRVASVVGLMMTSVLGYSDESAFEYAEKMGVAMQLTNILRDVQEDKAMGRIYLPRDEMQRFGVDENDILQERFSPELKAMMQFQVERAHHYYDEGDRGIKLLTKESRYAIAAASKIYRGILRKIEERGYNPFLGRVFVPPATKMKLLLQEVIRTKLWG
ncbi:MAG: phytoene/squalene synthase family protein [Bacteroidota bacterium]|nr:phytoene/squalene synthase family protein [Candidatus Kapabacteria bacterium]MDW8219133.1 phytoene/squalene synthase family protein [Bacteroidota bacterium]